MGEGITLEERAEWEKYAEKVNKDLAIKAEAVISLKVAGEIQQAVLDYIKEKLK